MDTAPTSNKPLAILDSDEIAQLAKVEQIHKRQMELIERARMALEEACFIAQAVENEKARIWRGFCERHGLDAAVEYLVDGAGRVFLPATA